MQLKQLCQLNQVHHHLKAAAVPADLLHLRPFRCCSQVKSLVEQAVQEQLLRPGTRQQQIANPKGLTVSKFCQNGGPRAKHHPFTASALYGLVPSPSSRDWTKGLKLGLTGLTQYYLFMCIFCNSRLHCCHCHAMGQGPRPPSTDQHNTFGKLKEPFNKVCLVNRVPVSVIGLKDWIEPADIFSHSCLA